MRKGIFNISSWIFAFTAFAIQAKAAEPYLIHRFHSDGLMKHWLLIGLLTIASCSEVIDDPYADDGSQDEAVLESPSAKVFHFIDQEGSPIDLSKVVILSEAIEGYALTFELESPSAKLAAEIEPCKNSISTYHFLATSSDGVAYRGSKDFFIAPERGYEATVTLSLKGASLLTDQSEWKKRTVREGIIWYNYEGLEPVTSALQVVNVLEVDLDNAGYQLEFIYRPELSKVSSVLKEDKEYLAVTNASFGSGADNAYIKIDGVAYKELDNITPSDKGNWYKHEAAVWLDHPNELGFINMAGDPSGAIEVYKADTHSNLLTSVPMLVEEYEMSDLTKYWAWKMNSFLKTKAEPRTALAVTHDRKLLLITVDGRWACKADGMTVGELQRYLRKNFYPRFAINMDGGGSTAMAVKGFGDSETNIVNYPCNGTGSDEAAPFDGTFKERKVVTFFVIKKK